jgi:hypothetical protein
MEPRKFITVFTTARHLSLSWARSIQSTPPHPTSQRFILILSSHLRLGLPSGSFPQVSPLKPRMHLSSPLYVPHVLPISVFLTWSPDITSPGLNQDLKRGSTNSPETPVPVQKWRRVKTQNLYITLQYFNHVLNYITIYILNFTIYINKCLATIVVCK